MSACLRSSASWAVVASGFILVQYIRLLDYRAAGIAVWFIAVTVECLTT